MASEPALQTRGLDVAYGVIRAVQAVDLEVPRGEVTALIGANGAGKSSLLKAIAGPVAPRAGRVLADGVDVTRLPTRERVLRHGVVLVPEGRGVFATMTVRENLELGLRVGRRRGAAPVTLDEVYDLFPVLAERSGGRVQYLSGGEQQMLAIARSLLMAPRTLLIDEPSMGLAPKLVRRIFAVLREVFAAREISVLLVEQDTALALSLATTAYLIEQGRVTARAPAAELRDDPRLKAAYLGTAGAAPAADPADQPADQPAEERRRPA